MNILHPQKELLTKLRNILLAFCKFLYPIFLGISLSFFIIAPFAYEKFVTIWGITIFLNVLNIMLFNSVFQVGPAKSPYSRVLTFLIYISFIVTALYSLRVLKFPLDSLYDKSFESGTFLMVIALAILTIYNICYTLAIFCSRKSWLSMIGAANTIIAAVVAIVYLILAFIPLP